MMTHVRQLNRPASLAGPRQGELARLEAFLSRPRWTDEEYRLLTGFLRYTEQDKAEARQATSIESLLAGAGISFPEGRNTAQRRCFLPGHPDQTPSMTLYRRTNSCYCFGCRTRLTTIETVMQLYGRSFTEAMDYLLGDCLRSARQLLRRKIEQRLAHTRAGRHSAPAGSGRLPDPPAGRERLALIRQSARCEEERRAELARDPAVLRLLEAATRFYQLQLAAHPAALNYLSGRGLSPATIKEARLGYAGGSGLSNWLVEQNLAGELAGEIGLLDTGGAGRPERMAGRIILPCTAGGQVVYLQGRRLEPAGEGAASSAPKYLGLKLPKPFEVCLNEFWPWPLNQSQDQDQIRPSGAAGTGRPDQDAAAAAIILVEGPFDCLAARQWGYPAVCTFGTHLSFPNRQLLKAALREQPPVRRVLLCFDNDPPVVNAEGRAVPGAGGRAMQELLEELGHQQAAIIRLPLGFKDLASLAEADGGRGEAIFRAAYNQALGSLGRAICKVE